MKCINKKVDLEKEKGGREVRKEKYQILWTSKSIDVQIKFLDWRFYFYIMILTIHYLLGLYGHQIVYFEINSDYEPGCTYNDRPVESTQRNKFISKTLSPRKKKKYDNRSRTDKVPMTPFLLLISFTYWRLIGGLRPLSCVI